MSLIFKSLCSVLIVFSLVSCRNSSKSASPDTINELIANPETVTDSETDLQLNGATASQIVLENGLKVIVVSSPTSKTASAAVGVQVGSSDNPIEAQGLAHFLEHMLFLGTKEFPVVGEYSQFLNANNGSSNAYTTANHTNYYFDVRADKIDEAIHRLSRFFVSPLFDTTFLEKEKSAVHNEFNLRLEDRKPSRAFSAFTLPTSQFRKFSVGNLDTLANASAEDTRLMFDKHYYAENMHAVISGPQSVSELKALAVKYFSDIKSNPAGVPNKYDQFLPLDLNQLPARLNLASKDGSKSVNFFIPVSSPEVEDSRTNSIIGSLLGDESPESLMVVLQNIGLARNGSGAISGAAYPSGLSVTVQLSDAGLANIDEVGSFIIGYIEFLKNQDLPAYLNDEGKLSVAASKVAASFFDVNSSLTQDINRAYFAAERDFNSWKELFIGKDLSPATVESYKSYLNKVNFAKMLIQVTAPNYKSLNYDYKKLDDIATGGIAIKPVGSKKAVVDSIYEFAYEIEDVDLSLYTAKGMFELKKPNVYVPRSFEVYTDGESLDFKMNKGAWGTVYTSGFEDTVLPHAFLGLELMSDKLDLNLKTDVASLFLLREMLRQQSASQSYAMLAAGFEISFPIFIDKGAIGVTFNGWSDNYEKAFSDMLGFTNLDISREDFIALKELYVDQIKLEASGNVGRIGSREMLSGVTPAYLSYDDLFTALSKIDHSTYTKFVSKYFSGLHIRGALSGNIKATTLDGVIAAVEKNWRPSWADATVWEQLYNPSALISENSVEENYVVQKTVNGTSESNALYNAFWSFGKPSSVKEKQIATILGQWLRPDYYEELRTRQQLAYSLYGIPWDFMGLVGLRLNLLSSTADVDAIESAVESYIFKWASDVLPVKTEELLESTVQNMLIRREAPVTPGGLHNHYLGLVMEDYTSLEAYEEEEAVLSTIELNDVVSFGQAKILDREKSGSFVKVTKKKEEPILAP